MSNVFVNVVLKNDLKDLTENVNKFKVSKGSVSGNSIEVLDKDTQSQSSYIYYDRNSDRDKDYELLLELIKTK